MLYDFAPMGYFTIEYDGSISELNFTGAEMLGERRISLINTNFKLYVSEDSLPKFNKFFVDVFSTGAKQFCDVMIVNNKNPLCHVYIEGIVTKEDQKCLMSAVDISSFKK